MIARVSAAEAARRLGCSASAVQNRRFHAGVRSTMHPLRRWTPAEDALLGTLPDAQLARRLRRPHGIVRRRREELGIRASRPLHVWTSRQIAMLGMKSDPDVARLLGLPTWSVYNKRLKLRIAAFKPRRRWTEAEDRLLGTAPAVELARRLKRTASAVRSRGRRVKVHRSARSLGQEPRRRPC